MTALYQITAELQAALCELDADGELNTSLADRLDALQLDMESKIEGCCKVIRNYTGYAAMLKDEAQKFAARAQSAENAATGIKAYVKANLEKVGITKLEAGLFKVRIQANSIPSTTFDGNPVNLPGDFQMVEYSLDAKAVIAAWREWMDKKPKDATDEIAIAAWQGEYPLPDGVKVEKGTHLRIG